MPKIKTPIFSLYKDELDKNVYRLAIKDEMTQLDGHVKMISTEQRCNVKREKDDIMKSIGEIW